MNEDEKVIEHLRHCDKHPERASIYTFENAIECIKQLRKERDDAQVDQRLIEELWQRRTDATEMGARIQQLLGNTEQLELTVARLTEDLRRMDAIVTLVFVSIEKRKLREATP
jgi:predicted enzyme involved in methoxymalonyl-ACP biosynthesis